MGWLANYRWLKSLRSQTLLEIDYAKKAATKAEMKAAKRIRKFPNVLAVYHALRLNNIDGGASRREVDLIVLMNDRIVLVEVKNYSGTITMNEDGELHQNGKNRLWKFDRLDDAKRRLVDIMRETGIQLGKGEVHSILALLGSGTADKSVTIGTRLTGATVAKSLPEIGDFLSQPLGDDGTLSSKHVEAINKFLEMCGTWDTMVLANGVELEGDILSKEPFDDWRQEYRKGRFSNQRGWIGTIIFGPDVVANLVGWDDQEITLSIKPDMTLHMRQPGAKLSTAVYSIDHLQGFEFGYKELPDWQKIILMKPEKDAATQSNSNKKPIATNKNIQPYEKGDVIKDASVTYHHEAGIMFKLDSNNKGMYFSTNMTHSEWNMREVFYAIGSPIDVKVTKISKKGRKWNIQVSPVND
jgi:hypothetical protein